MVFENRFSPQQITIVDDAQVGADTLHFMLTIPGRTVIGVVATNVKLTKAEAGRVAQMAQDGLARTIRPAHTMLDGDTIFALSTGRKKADVSTIGAFAAEALMQAILCGTQSAASLGGVPGLGE